MLGPVIFRMAENTLGNEKMKQNQWFAVRCCCTPQKVFGFIKLTAPESHINLPDHRTLTDNYGQQHPIKLMSIYVNKHYPCSLKNFKDFMNFTPPQEVIEHTAPEIAIYSDDRPIEFWRTIPGFVEAPPTEEED